MTTYTIKSGDSLSRIASDYDTTVQDLIEANKSQYPSLVTAPDQIQVGWNLMIPDDDSGVPSAPSPMTAGLTVAPKKVTPGIPATTVSLGTVMKDPKIILAVLAAGALAIFLGGRKQAPSSITPNPHRRKRKSRSNPYMGFEKVREGVVSGAKRRGYPLYEPSGRGVTAVAGFSKYGVKGMTMLSQAAKKWKKQGLSKKVIARKKKALAKKLEHHKS